MATIPDATRNAMVDALTALIGTNGKLKFYNSVPTLLSTCLLAAADAFGDAAAGVATANAIAADTSAAASGTVVSADLTTSGGVVVLTMTAGQTDEEIVFNSAAFVAGDNISVTSLTITQPAN